MTTVTRSLAPIPLLLLCSCSGAQAPETTASGSSAPAGVDPARPLPSPLPQVVARVNGQEVRLAQILPLARATLQKLSSEDASRQRAAAVRHALDEYVTRELLLQEALARGIQADTRTVERAYDQMRGEHPEEADWAKFLSGQGLDPQSVKAELRVQYTVAALLESVVQAWPVPEAEARQLYDENPRRFTPPEAEQPPPFEAVRFQAEQAVRRARVGAIQAELVRKLRSSARIETYL